MYKLIALDIDGTLLNSNGEILDSTRKVIKRCIEKGILVTISTGRPIQGVRKIINDLGLKHPIITYNGAVIVEATSEDVLFKKNMLDVDARKVIDVSLSHDIQFIIWSDNKLYSNQLSKEVEFYKSISGVEPIITNDFNEVIKQGITKILWIDKEEVLSNWIDKLCHFGFYNLDYYTSRSIFLEFMDSDISKAKAMKFIGKKNNIKKEEMIAFGDGDNDISMIEYAGLGICMGNSTDKLKSKANFITLSNDENGIEFALNKYLFNK